MPRPSPRHEAWLSQRAGCCGDSIDWCGGAPCPLTGPSPRPTSWSRSISCMSAYATTPIHPYPELALIPTSLIWLQGAVSYHTGYHVPASTEDINKFGIGGVISCPSWNSLVLGGIYLTFQSIRPTRTEANWGKWVTESHTEGLTAMLENNRKDGRETYQSMNRQVFKASLLGGSVVKNSLPMQEMGSILGPGRSHSAWINCLAL